MTKEQRQDYADQKCAELHAINEVVKSVWNNRVESDDELLTMSGAYDIDYKSDLFCIAL